MDEGVRAGKGDPRCDRWMRGPRGEGGSAERIRWCEKDSATRGKKIALSVKRTVPQGCHQRTTRMTSTWDKDDAL